MTPANCTDPQPIPAAAWREAVTRFLTDDELQHELVTHAQGRAVLCAATQLHDRNPDGHCRDCGTLLAPDAAACDDTRTLDLERTPFGGIR